MKHLKTVIAQFRIKGSFSFAIPYGSGHINDTYRVVCNASFGETHYILQRINHHVFQNVPALMENIGRVLRHQRAKLEATQVADLERRVMTLIPTHEGGDFLHDTDGNFWRVYRFVENGTGIDVVKNPHQAFEAAKTFGRFQAQLSDLPGRLHETIPDFHHTRNRFNTLIEIIEKDPCNRAAEVQKEIRFAQEHEEMVDVVLDLLASGELPERVTHNDTKLNNVLLDTHSGEGLCVIDLDTVMPGSILYDFGDMVRTTTSSAAEDERNLEKLEMNLTYFEALLEGYLSIASDFLTPKEIELLPFSGALISFEIGLRFLTDYLQGDLYFKTHRSGQNRDRCRKQFKMVASIERQMKAMQRIVEKY